MEKLTNCPVCKSSILNSYIQAKDYLVSNESYNINECGTCTLRFTNPRPSADEILKFYQSEQYVSHNDTARGFINNIYQQVKQITLQQKIRLIKKYSAAPKLLDYGCGTGDFVAAAVNGGIEAVGMEPSGDARDKAIKKGLTVEPVEELFKKPAGYFDVITLWHVLEHIHDLEKVFNQLCLTLKEGGYLFVALPNSNSTDALMYNEHWAAFDVPRHLYHFTPSSFNYFISLFPVELIEKKTMPFDPFYIALLSEKYKTGSNNFLNAVFNGLTAFVSGYKEVDKSSSIIYILKRK